MNIYVRTVGNGYQVVGLQHADILRGTFRNFSKEQRSMDSGTVRHFAVRVEDENVEKLRSFGFNVGYYEPKDNPEAGHYFLDINLGWQLRDPNIYVVENGKETKQTEMTIGTLDKSNSIVYADIEVSPHHWNNNGRSGIKPWVSEMFIYMAEPSPIRKNFQNYVESFTVQQPDPAQPELPFEEYDPDMIPL